MGDGRILDLHTGLFWLKDANCFGTKTWNNAMDAADNLADSQCGLTDCSVAGEWRLPTIDEWKAFVAGVSPNNLYTNPDLCNTAGTGQWSQGGAFDNVQSFIYWSSTDNADDTSDAWYMYMYFGGVYSASKGYIYYVWPVRGGN